MSFVKKSAVSMANMETCIFCSQEFSDARGKRGVCPVCHLRCMATDQITEETDHYSAAYATHEIAGHGQVYYFPKSAIAHTEVFLYDTPDTTGPVPTYIHATCKNGTVFIV